MPQNSAALHNKKKKGRAPAHQNTFAFRHNPKSKKTLAILALPNVHVCRRCHDKIEWRKKYRKYKPLTQPSKCNLCEQRNVLAAYHTICGKCSVTDKAKTIVRDHLKTVEQERLALVGAAAAEAQQQKQGETDNLESALNSTSLQDDPSSTINSTTDQPDASLAEASSTWEGRACCMCVKEFALTGTKDEHDGDNEDPLLSGGKLSLRQRKTLERQKQARRKKQKEGELPVENDIQPPKQGDENRADSDDDFGDMSTDDDDDDDDDDPFLNAVGGADKLLTGEAYQKALLEKEQQRQQQN